jgi:hypothetical protein
MPDAIESPENSDDLIEMMLTRPIINLDLAGILYVAAYESYLHGEKLYSKLLKKIQTYNAYKERKNRKWHREFMLKKLRELELHYEPVVRELSTSKILLVNSAEAYINEVANCELSGRQFSEFDKLSIVGKWQFLPLIMKLKKNPFSLDRNPLQGFSKLASDRNKLVHFKGYRNILENQNLPNFIVDYNLTPKSCKQALDAVKSMIEKLSLGWVGSYGPDWINFPDKNARRPCFYMYARNCASYLYSGKYDKSRFEEDFENL